MKLWFSLVLFAGAADASVFDRDDRIAEVGTPVEMEAIGVVTGGQAIRHATGFLVSRCEVLTVKHAAGRVATALGRRLRFTSGGTRSRGTVVAEGEIDLVTQWAGSDRRGDWLLLRLDRCVNDQRRQATLSRVPLHLSGHWAPGGQGFQSAGFPKPRHWRHGVTRDPNCRVRMVAQGMIFNDCAALPGDSGSPLFAIDRSGTRSALVVFAMQSASGPGSAAQAWQADRSSVAIPVGDIAERIAPFLTFDVTARRPQRSPCTCLVDVARR